MGVEKSHNLNLIVAFVFHQDINVKSMQLVCIRGEIQSLFYLNESFKSPFFIAFSFPNLITPRASDGRTGRTKKAV